MPSLYQQIPAGLPDELIDLLCQSADVRIERIVSRGHSSPDGFWYDQEWHEFLLLMSGRARLGFDDGSPFVELNPGDWLDIKAHVRHRVEWTAPDADTVWLAVHYRPAAG